MNYKLLTLYGWLKDNNFKKESESLMRIIKTSMLIRGEDQSGVVAYKEYIWLVDPMADNIDENIKKEISNSIGLSEDSGYDDWSSYYELRELLEEAGRGDFLMGTIDDNILYLETIGALSFDPKSSILVSKVVKALGLDSVESRSFLDDTDRTYGYEMKGNINNIGYHGTTEKYLRDILSLGIKPGESETNYKEIAHEDAVFFTSQFGEAQSHATHTATREGVGGDPMIIEFEIPNKDLIIPDYDVDILSENTGIYDYVQQKRQSDDPKMKGNAMSLSREFGIYGYKGRIPASFIKSYYVLLNSEQMHTKEEVAYMQRDEYTRLSPEQAMNYVNSKEEVGFGYIEPREEWEEDEDDDWETEEEEVISG